MRITHELLKRMRACKDARAAFNELFPTGMQLTVVNVRSACSRVALDDRWFTRRVLNAAAYCKMVNALDDSYQKYCDGSETDHTWDVRDAQIIRKAVETEANWRPCWLRHAKAAGVFE